MKTTKDTLLNYFKSVARSEQEYDMSKIELLSQRLQDQINKNTESPTKKQMKELSTDESNLSPF